MFNINYYNARVSDFSAVGLTLPAKIMTDCGISTPVGALAPPESLRTGPSRPPLLKKARRPPLSARGGGGG